MKFWIGVFFVLAVPTSSLFAADAPKPLAPTHGEVSYGPHARNVLDFWKAEGNGPVHC